MIASFEQNFLSSVDVKNEIEKLGYVFDDIWSKYFMQYKIINYKLVQLRLSDLYIDDWMDKHMGVPTKIKDSPNYKYLCGDKAEYITRCQNEPSHSCEKFDKLIQQLDAEGFDSVHIICVDENNHIVDGAHRASWLAYKYGENFNVTVLKLYIKH